jgi:hypothetical protein
VLTHTPHPTGPEARSIESVERAGLIAWLDGGVEVCALSALCAVWVEVAP